MMNGVRTVAGAHLSSAAIMVTAGPSLTASTLHGAVLAAEANDPPPSGAPGTAGAGAKRLLDLGIAASALLLLLPLLVLIAAAIKLTMPGPIFFAHRRVGLNGRTFPCLKFRTMVRDGDAVLARYLVEHPAAAEEWGRTQKLLRDPRVTRLGYVLRKSSLDELPQFLNVLCGHMSCVGPRPIVPAELERYGVHGVTYMRVRPGITGLWQTSGRSLTGYDERVALDCTYVQSWSLILDLKILLRTIPAVMRTSHTA